MAMELQAGENTGDLMQQWKVNIDDSLVWRYPSKRLTSANIPLISFMCLNWCRISAYYTCMYFLVLLDFQNVSLANDLPDTCISKNEPFIIQQLNLCIYIYEIYVIIQFILHIRWSIYTYTYIYIYQRSYIALFLPSTLCWIKMIPSCLIWAES